MTADQKLAWALLEQILIDLSNRKRNRARQRHSREIASWIANDASRAKFNPSEAGFEYTFEYWCQQLGQDPGYMARKLKENLL